MLKRSKKRSKNKKNLLLFSNNKRLDSGDDDDDDDDDENSPPLIQCFCGLWKYFCCCGYLAGYREPKNQRNCEASHGRDVNIRLWPNYNQEYVYKDNNELNDFPYDFYLCPCMPHQLAAPLNHLCGGCLKLRFSGRRGFGWLLSSRAGRTRCFSWIIILLFSLFGGLLWSRTNQLNQIHGSPCYVCQIPPIHTADPHWYDDFIPTIFDSATHELVLPDTDATQALARYAVYTHGPSCSIDDSYVMALDQTMNFQWKQRWLENQGRDSGLFHAWKAWNAYQSGGPESAFHGRDSKTDTRSASAIKKKGYPEWFVIGCRGSGTTSLSQYLEAHPQVWIGSKAGTDHFFATFPDWSTKELEAWISIEWPAAGITPKIPEEEEIFAPEPEQPPRYKKKYRRRRGSDAVLETPPPQETIVGSKEIQDQHIQSQKTKKRNLRRQRFVRAGRRRYWKDEDRIRIEVSTDYYWAVGLGTAASIRRANPKARFLVLISDPIQLMKEAHARAVQAGLEDRSFHQAIAEELPKLIHCLLWDAADHAEQRDRLVSGACGGLQPGPGPPYIWRGMVSEFLLDWFRILPGRQRYYFIRAADLLMQPNRTLNRFVVDALNLESFDFTPYVKRIYKPRPEELKKIVGATWSSSRSNVPRTDYIAQMRKKTSDALLEIATKTVEENIPGAKTVFSLTEAARRLHCKIMQKASGSHPENRAISLMMYHCEAEIHQKKKNKKNKRKRRSDAVDGSAAADETLTEAEVLAMLRQFMEPYQVKLLQLMTS